MIVVVAAVVAIVEVLILVEGAGLKFLSHPKCAIYAPGGGRLDWKKLATKTGKIANPE